MIKIHDANQALKVLFTEDSALHTPEKNYILRLGQKAEGLQARVTVLQQQKKLFKSGRRVSIEGKHLLTAEDVYQNVMKADMRIAMRKNKGKSVHKKVTPAVETSSEDEMDIEILDSIEVRPYEA